MRYGNGTWWKGGGQKKLLSTLKGLLGCDKDQTGGNALKFGVREGTGGENGIPAKRTRGTI